MFGTLGGPELFLILVVALIVFGPRKLPEMGKSLGRMMAEFRKASNDFQRTIEEEVEEDNRRPKKVAVAPQLLPPEKPPALPEEPVATQGTSAEAAVPADSVSRDGTPTE